MQQQAFPQLSLLHSKRDITIYATLAEAQSVRKAWWMQAYLLTTFDFLAHSDKDYKGEIPFLVLS